MMARYRSILALLLAFVATFVVSCSTPTETAKTYTPAQFEQLQTYADGLQQLRDRFPELATLIQKRQWNDVDSFIHGPLGDIRFRMRSFATNLLPDARKAALDQSKEVFDSLVKIDEAAQAGDYELAIRNYAEAIKNLDAFLGLAPEA